MRDLTKHPVEDSEIVAVLEEARLHFEDQWRGPGDMRAELVAAAAERVRAAPWPPERIGMNQRVGYSGRTSAVSTILQRISRLGAQPRP